METGENTEQSGRGWGRTSGEREGAFTPNVGELYHPACEERTRDTDNAQDDLLYAPKLAQWNSFREHFENRLTLR